MLKLFISPTCRSIYFEKVMKYNGGYDNKERKHILSSLYFFILFLYNLKILKMQAFKISWYWKRFWGCREEIGKQHTVLVGYIICLCDLSWKFLNLYLFKGLFTELYFDLAHNEIKRTLQSISSPLRIIPTPKTPTPDPTCEPQPNSSFQLQAKQEKISREIIRKRFTFGIFKFV